MGLGQAKPESNTEKLDRLVEAINSAEDLRVLLQERKTAWVENLITYGLGLYFLLCGLVYVVGVPPLRARTSLLCCALYPILLLVVREAVIWVFDLRLRSTVLRLDSLRSEKKRVMETIMRTETYRTLRACLERVGGDEVPKATVEPTVTLPAAPLQQPQPASQQPPLPSAASANLTRRPMQPQKSAVRCLVDRVLEYVAGEGLNNRFALICSQCSSHNGLALREEYDYLAFRCFSCRYFNPARKLRPIAPRLGASPTGTDNDEDEADDVKENNGVKKRCRQQAERVT